MLNKTYQILFFIIIFFIFSSASCERDKLRFPYVPIQLELGINSDLADLGVYQAKLYPNHGLQGIVVWRNDVDEYHVYDLACTFEEDFSCAVEEDSSFEGVMECPCCHSKFLLYQNADPFEGPASWPLIEYNSYIDGGFLVIRN